MTNGSSILPNNFAKDSGENSRQNGVVDDVFVQHTPSTDFEEDLPAPTVIAPGA